MSVSARNGSIAFQPRARLLKLIGEELISDEVVAHQRTRQERPRRGRPHGHRSPSRA